MQSTSSSSNAIEQAISFLTTPLSRTTVAASSITILQAHLYGSLTQLSTSGSSSRTYKIVLRLASSIPPPDCIARACDASGVNWSEWLFLIGGGMGLDLDVQITPNAVTASFSRAGTPSLGLVTVWQREEPQQLTSRELLYADDDSEDLFNEINRSQHSPSWLSSWSMNVAPSRAPALTAPVAVPKMGPVPLSARSHSRSSSYASTNSSSSHSHHNSPYNAHANTFGNYTMGNNNNGGEPMGSGCSSSGSNASGSPPTSIYSLSEDGSSGSSGGNMSWTRRGTVVPGPQQSAIMAARNAHHAQQAFNGVPPVPAINIDHVQGHHRSSPSISSASSATSGSSNGKHRRQRSTTNSANVVVDPSKASVTAYDGGKTKVMTGGVMLGSVNSGKKRGH